MKEKYLLYIDILGFSNLVMKDEFRVQRLYNLIDSLNVYTHASFKTIVFSDTILVYNIDDPYYKEDHQYLVMYLIEFAQDFLYRSIGKGYYFRGVLVHDEFEHSKQRNIESIFGKSVVKSYRKTNNIECTGLFIDKKCQPYNNIFPVAEYDEDVYFVYLNQSLERLNRGDLGNIPLDSWLLCQTDSQWDLAKDVRMLKDIYHQMRKHRDPKIRKKFLTTWDFYYRRYPELIHKLASGNFNLSVICLTFDWSDACSRTRILDGYRGYGISAPSIKDFKNIIKVARNAGQKAAKNKYKELVSNAGPDSKMLASCGGASILLDVDGRCAMGKFLESIGNTIKNISISKDPYKNGFYIHVQRMHNRQEKIIDEVAAEAALKVLKDKLGIDGYVLGYDS